MMHIIIIGEIIKIGIDQIAETIEFNLVDKVKVDQGVNRIIGMITGGKCENYQNCGRQNRGGYRGNYRNESYNIERCRSRSRERSFSGYINNRRNNRSISYSRSR